MAYDKKYYENHKEKFLEASKRYFAKKRAEADPEWLDKQNQYMKDYYSKNPDKREAKNNYNKNYYQTHKDYFKAKAKEYYEEKKKCKK